MPDILLVQPPIRDFYLTAKRTVPYGLACIASALIEADFSVSILDGLATAKSKIIDLPETLTYLEPHYGKEDRTPFALFHHYRHYGYSFEHLARQAQIADAYLVGISSLFTPYINDALETAAAIKRACPDTRIVMGGHHANALPETVMAHPAVDFVLRGDGEITMPALAMALRNGDGLEKVPGIVFRRADNSLYVSPPARIRSSDDFRIPTADLINQKYYRRQNGNSAVIVACRGCPLGCSYCSLRRSDYTKRPVASIIREMEIAVEERGARFINFEDENLTLDPRWFDHLLAEIIDRFKPYPLELRAMNGLYPPALTNQQIRQMKKAGFRSLNLSLATTDLSQLDRFQRPDVRNDFERVLHQAAQNDMQAVGYIIVGAPGQHARQSVSDLLYLAGQRVLAGVSVFYPAPGSPDFDRCRELEILPESFDRMRSSALPLSHTTSRTESATLMRLGRILNFMKHLIDSGRPIPSASEFKNGTSLDPADRISTGLQLLRWFLHDGQIRGITSDGQIYTHRCDQRLTGQFIEGLQKIKLKGTI